MDLKSICW